ncbi:MAG: CBS domain-containing protein [Nocardioidaceae bacterium]
MRAKDMVGDYPIVRCTDAALDAARLIGSQRLPGVVVVDDSGQPITVLPGSQVLNFLIPAYIQDDPSLARVYDEGAADRCVERLTGKTVGDMLPDQNRRMELPVVDSDATVLECSAVMARLHSPLLVVQEGSRIAGVVTTSRLLDALFG